MSTRRTARVGRKSAAHSATGAFRGGQYLGHAVGMPDYRRNRIPGATYFFTVNLRQRRSDLLVQHIDTLRHAVRKVRRRSPFHIDAWVVLPDHMHCLWTLPKEDSDFPSRWFPEPLAGHQDGVLEIRARDRASLGGHGPPGRTRNLAAPILGAHDSRRSRLCRSHGLHPFQPGKARVGGQPGRLAILQLPALCSGRALSGRLARRRRRTGGDRRAVIIQAAECAALFHPTLATLA
jgi:hypothetical protein